MTALGRAAAAVLSEPRWADRTLMVMLGALAFLLGCYELFDSDVWWHVKSGLWILTERRVPRLDPFTYTSADRAWVDLHWGFQVALACAHRIGGVRGMILLAASAGAGAFVIALTARERHWPFWVAAVSWLPALVLLSTRFDPRPEVFSLLFLASFLAILLRLERRPVLAWALPLIQLLWVNSHSLFVLGPFVLGCYLIDRVAQAMGLGWNRSWQGGRRWWWIVAPASAAVVLACLVNPYGLKGALFPLELFPKISDWGGPYKAHIDELMSLRMFVQRRTPGVAAGNLYFRAHYFLLLVVPWTFLLPAAWGAWDRARSKSASSQRSTEVWVWVVGVGVVLALALADTLGLPAGGMPPWVNQMGRRVPLAMLAVGIVAMLALVRWHRASVIAAVGVLAIAAWSSWLRVYLFGESPLHGALGAVGLAGAAGLFGAFAAWFVIVEGGSLFRMLLALAFGYLGLQAIRNTNLFGLVAGMVIAWNLGEWAARLANGFGQSTSRGMGPIARWALVGLVGLWIIVVVTDRFYPMTGEALHFGLRERPLIFAHEAARFAGEPGLPRRAIAFDLGQAGAYVFHDGPEHKVFMDGRLEVPDRSTFEAYLRLEDWLNRGDPHWASLVHQMGDPLILLQHEGEAAAEATLLSDPRWRCVYFDAVASVFVPGRAGPPEVDFATRHFTRPRTAPVPDVADAAKAEARALLALGMALRRRVGDPWLLRIPALLLAGDRLRPRIAERVADPWVWTTLGNCQWEMVPDLTRKPPAPSDPWDPATGLFWARATYCYRQALVQAPDDVAALRSLSRILGVRGMNDARDRVEARLRVAQQRSTSAMPPSWHDATELAAAAEKLLEEGRPEAAVGLLVEATDRRISVPWSLVDRLAATALHLGDPATARKAWEEAQDPPSRALQLAQVASTFLVAMDANAAVLLYREALALQPDLGEARFGLTLAHLLRGDAKATSDACREALRCRVTPAQQEVLEGIASLASRSSRSSRQK